MAAYSSSQMVRVCGCAAGVCVWVSHITVGKCSLFTLCQVSSITLPFFTTAIRAAKGNERAVIAMALAAQCMKHIYCEQVPYHHSTYLSSIWKMVHTSPNNKHIYAARYIEYSAHFVMVRVHIACYHQFYAEH